MRRSRRLCRRRRRSSRRPSCNGGSFCIYYSVPGGDGVSRARRAARAVFQAQVVINARGGRVTFATEHAPRDPLRVLERRDGLAEMVECGFGSARCP